MRQVGLLEEICTLLEVLGRPSRSERAVVNPTTIAQEDVPQLLVRIQRLGRGHWEKIRVVLAVAGVEFCIVFLLSFVSFSLANPPMQMPLEIFSAFELRGSS
ncbi:hypothetical protein DENSPDRAFT_838898 [Dentipellis sp. KUC8613]|nr:hypothetical protein DENSPDRAFT_838898 [Dentipellis sp. KUC8613]